jgi:hypothetical protein
MKNILKLICLVLFLFFQGIVFADQITLKDGQNFTGKLIKRTETSVIFEIGGQQMKFPLSNVQNVQVDFNSAPSGPPPAVPAPEPVKQRIEVAAGSTMVVSLQTPLESGRHATGHRFKATLEGNLMAGNKVAAPSGATVYGRVISAHKSGRVVGQAHMNITFTDIMVNNRMYPIQTTTVSTKAGRTIGKTARTTAGAAAIGGLIDGSDGAKTGAKVGLGASILTKGKQVKIPAGTLFDVRMTSPLILN